MEEKTASVLLEKKLKFRQSAKTTLPDGIENLSGHDCREGLSTPHPSKQEKLPSLMSFLKTESTKEYYLFNDEERFSAGREKFYSFMKIPKEVEKFMIFGVMNCVDCFLFIYTYLPLRVILGVWALLTRPFSKCFGSGDHRNRKILTSAEICDLLTAIIFIVSTAVLCLIDVNMMYHVIKSQSVIKLYIFYNMLDIGDKLLISFGQDSIDALLWTATEPKGRKREHLGVVPHLFFGIVYVIMHSTLILFQATSLNVAINARNKALLTIMISNNFVELKGSVFKKFDKSNLFQVSCSDVRERFNLFVLLFLVILQTLKGYNWNLTVLPELIFDGIIVLVAELMVDWIKHAFITRFNELNVDVYKDFKTSIAYDLSYKLHQPALSGRSHLVARRMGFIPLPLGVFTAKILLASFNFNNLPTLVLLFVGYLCLWSIKILNMVLVFGKSCSIIAQYKSEKTAQNSPSSYRSEANEQKYKSPEHHFNQQPRKVVFKNNGFTMSSSFELRELADLGGSPIFHNSTVDFENASLNEEMLKANGEDIKIEQIDNGDLITRSVPDLKDQDLLQDENEVETLKKSESEPNLLKEL